MSVPCASCANDRPEVGIYLFWPESEIVTRVERVCPTCLRAYQGLIGGLLRAGGADRADLELMRRETGLVC